MMSKAIENIIEAEYLRVYNSSDASLAYGAMGVALFMVWYGTQFKKKEYVSRGVQLIEQRCTALSGNDPLDFHKGQVGIGMGILSLYRMGIIEGNINNIYKELDDNIFRAVVFANKLKEEHVGTLIDIALFIAFRLKYHTYDEINSKINQRLLSKIINSIFPSFYQTIFVEPYPGGYGYHLPKFIFLLSLSLGNKFDQRILRIIDEIQPLVLSQFPYMVSNRIALSNAITTLANAVKLDYRWSDFANLLDISITSKEIDAEFKKYQLSLYNGFGWLAIQEILAIQIKKESYKLQLLPKFTESNIFNLPYNELMKRDLIGLYGILGLIIVYYYLNAI